MARLLIKKICETRKISKRQLALAMGYKKGSAQNVHRLMQRTGNPRIDTLIRCAKALGLKVSDLIIER